MDKQLKTLKEKRSIQYRLFVSAMAQLKKQIAVLEDRIQREGDTINFSANSDFVDNALSIWKASHRIYQIDDLILMLQGVTKEIDCATPDDAHDTQKTNASSNTPD
jgi:hypothetical protein